MNNNERLILLDFNNLFIISGSTLLKNNILSKDILVLDILIRLSDIIVTNILDNKNEEYTINSLVIAVDGNNYWRKKHFPYYKVARKVTDDLKQIFDLKDDVLNELRENTNFKIIQNTSLEADDIISVLSLSFPEKEKFIISSDSDFFQLQTDKKVIQFSPRDNLFKVCDDPLRFLQEKIIKGDDKDSIPNIFTQDDHFSLETKPRQMSVTKELLEDFIVLKKKDEIIEKYTNGFETKGGKTIKVDLKKNIERNNKLINFRKVDKEVIDVVLKEYENKDIDVSRIFDDMNRQSEYLEKFNNKNINRLEDLL